MERRAGHVSGETADIGQSQAEHLQAVLDTVAPNLSSEAVIFNLGSGANFIDLENQTVFNINRGRWSSFFKPLLGKKAHYLDWPIEDIAEAISYLYSKGLITHEHSDVLVLYNFWNSWENRRESLKRAWDTLSDGGFLVVCRRAATGGEWLIYEDGKQVKTDKNVNHIVNTHNLMRTLGLRASKTWLFGDSISSAHAIVYQKTANLSPLPQKRKKYDGITTKGASRNGSPATDAQAPAAGQDGDVAGPAQTPSARRARLGSV